MKKLLVTIAAIGVLIFEGTVHATPITNTIGDNKEDINPTTVYDYYQNSGSLLGVHSGNANPSDPTDVQTYLNTLTGFSNVDLSILNTDSIIVEFYGSSGLSGTWSTAAAGYNLEFYAVKAGNAYALYQVTPSDNYGSWSTYDIWKSGLQGTGGNGGVEISHFVGYNPDSTPVPEPSTLLMLGAGLLGLGMYKYRRVQK